VDRQIEMDLSELKEVAEYFYRLGSRAMTITGGGEPTIHPGIDEFINYTYDMGYHLGLVTNGLAWGNQKMDLPANGKLIWTRMSIIDTESGTYPVSRIQVLSENLSEVDMGISFTVSKKTSIKTAREVSELCEAIPNMTHIRFVEDIVEFAAEKMNEVESACSPISTKAIFQRRKQSENGCKRCLISLLKPMVDATGYVYPCCGVQYAAGEEKQALNMPDIFRMCHWRDWPPQVEFNGSICKKCYYGDYNRVLDGLTQELSHERFL